MLLVDPATQGVRTEATFNGRLVEVNGVKAYATVQAPFGATTAEPPVEIPAPTPENPNAVKTICVFHTINTDPTNTDPSMTRPVDVSVGGYIDNENPPGQVFKTITEAFQWFPSTPPGSDLATDVAINVTAEPLGATTARARKR